MSDKEEDKKLTFKESLSIIFWAFKFQFKTMPIYSAVNAISLILMDLDVLVNAYIIGKVIDGLVNLSQQKSYEDSDLFSILAILLIYNLISYLVTEVNGYTNNQIRFRFYYKAKELLALKLNSLGISTLEDPAVANIVHRTNSSFNLLANYYSRLFYTIARIIRMIIAALAIATILPAFIPIFFLAALPLVIANRYFVKKDWEFFRKNTDYSRRSEPIVDSYLSAPKLLQEIAITGGFSYLIDKYNRFSEFYLKVISNNWRKWYIVTYLLQGFAQIVTIIGYFNLFKKILSDDITVGIATFYIRSISLFVNSVDSVNSSIIDLYESSIKLKDAKDLFTMKPMFTDGSIELERMSGPPSINLNNINFTYPNSSTAVIKNLNLIIRPGEKIAIVGHNGAGKTTLVKLLARFYKVSSGEIKINENYINDLKIDSWYKNLGILFQEFNTYTNLTAKENILMGDVDSGINEQRIIDAAKNADAFDFISKYDNGFDKILSESYEGGTRPSTGQWQKIAIARFFYRNVPVIIFDEPTAAIDAVAESKIFNKIYEFFKDKTVIIISHRFSTVRNADRIIVMDDGQIVEQGSHAELMALGGKYKEAFLLQAEGYN